MKHKIIKTGLIGVITAVLTIVTFCISNTVVFAEEPYSYTISNNAVTITECDTSVSGEIIIPAELEGYPVTTLKNNAFKDCSKITKVSLPESIKKIGNSAFENCSSLESINIPDGITQIGQYTFYGCSVLDNVILPDSVTEIGIRSFQNCRGLKTIDIGKGVTAIRTEAFLNCVNIKSVKLPETLKTIWPYAFHNCDSLDKINIPDSVVYLGKSAFGHCINATELIIGNNVSNLDDTVFWSCSKIEEVVVPESITNIPDHFFDSCYSLKKITLHDGIKSIGIHAFCGTKIETIDLPEELETIAASAFFSCKKLRSVQIPENVSLISEGAFNLCPSIENFVVSPENEYYSNDEYGALFNKDKTLLLRYPAGSKNVTYIIPESVTNISSYTFMDCSNIKELVYGNGMPEIKSAVINYAESLVCIHIPSSVTSITSSYTGSAYICSDSETAYAKTYAETSGADFVVCDGTHPEYFNLSFKIKDEFTTNVVKHGDSIIVPTIHENENSVFEGWIDDSGAVVGIPETMPEKDLSFTAKFKTVIKNDSYDISAVFDENTFGGQKITLSVEVLKDSNNPDASDFYEMDGRTRIGLYSIKALNSNSEPVQPINGKVTIKIPIPESFANYENYTVGHFYDGGHEIFKTNPSSKYEKEIKKIDGYLVFEIEHFSEFAVCIEMNEPGQDEPAEKTVSSVSVATLPSKTSYTYKTDNLDLSGLALTVTYSDGTTETVTDTSKMKITGFDNTKTGTQTVSAEYAGASASFDITVSYAWWQWIIRILLLGFLWY